MSFVFISVTSFATSEIFVFKSNPASLQEVEDILNQYPVGSQTLTPTQLENLFAARQSAHRLRLSELIMKLNKDPDFLNKFPEFKPLMKDLPKTVAAALQHDAKKASDETKNAAKILARTEGIYYRNIPKEIPSPYRERLAYLMKGAVDDINVADKLHMDSTLKSLSSDPEWRTLHDKFVSVLDYYDTYKSRQLEMNGGTSKLKPPSEWLDIVAKESGSKENNELEKKFAQFLEQKDPLRDASKFSQAEDFLKPTASGTPQGSQTARINKSFDVKAKALIPDPKIAFQVPKVGKLLMALDGLKKSAYAAVVIEGIKYVINPDEATWRSTLEGLIQTDGISNCQTITCGQFRESCEALTHAPANSSLESLAKQKDFQLCLDRFFQLPLEKQTSIRGDRGLDIFLNFVSPSVVGLSCSKNGTETKVDVETRDRENNITKQALSYSSKGLIRRYSSVQTDEAEEIVMPLQPQDQRLKHCYGPKNCDYYDMTRVASERLYFWKQQLGPWDKDPRNIPIDAFKWARNATHLVRDNSKQVLECCDRKSCKDYFDMIERNTNRHKQELAAKKTQISR